MKNLSVQVYESLKEKIINNALPTNEALTETEIASQYGVSRNTAKKALLMLSNDGLVSFEQYKSAQIHERSLEEVVSLLELREVLEAYIVKNAVQHISQHDIEKLYKILERMHAHVERHELREYVQCNYEFHDIIFNACNNHMAIKMTMQVKNLLRKYSLKTILIPMRDQASYEEHLAIYEAIRQRDSAAAAAAMQVHISNLKKTFEDNVDLLL